jgi:hypothetical protein
VLRRLDLDPLGRVQGAGGDLIEELKGYLNLKNGSRSDQGISIELNVDPYDNINNVEEALTASLGEYRPQVLLEFISTE